MIKIEYIYKKMIQKIRNLDPVYYVLYCIFIVFLKYVYFVFVSPDFYTTSAESPMPVRWQPLWSFSYSE